MEIVKHGFKIKILIIIALFLLMIFGVAINNKFRYSYKCEKECLINLYGEFHAVKEHYDKEFRLWEKYYKNNNMRDLFLELSYDEAQWLNIWMGQKNNDNNILNNLYKDLEGTQDHNKYFILFFKRIKKNCPETIFHGTDISHQYDSSGERYLKYLLDRDMKDTEQYKIALDCVKQGRYYYVNNRDDEFREKAMTENFIREYNSVCKSGKKKIMGIYGDYHCDPRKNIMAGRLKKYYGDIICYDALSKIKL